jgi:hypothetical protein
MSALDPPSLADAAPFLRNEDDGIAGQILRGGNCELFTHLPRSLNEKDCELQCVYVPKGVVSDAEVAMMQTMALACRKAVDEEFTQIIMRKP